MSVRKLSVQEINAVASILNDKEALSILKEINDNIITEEDTKGKRKGNEVFNFVGFASGDDILVEEDQESEEYQNKKGLIKKLVDAGLLLEGLHVSLERKSETKFGDARLPNTDDKIYKYKLTEEGLAVLAIINNSNNNGQKQEQEQQSKPPAAASKSNGNNNSKSEIAAFKAKQNKELGRK